MKKLELLSPSKNLLVGKTAIDNGADAVYLGASLFGARKSAGNSLEDIREMVDYAHRFYARVYVTLNTILYEEELKEAEKLISEIYHAGVDALIIQDPGILRMDLPPISLHASTQMHNYDLERIKFLDKVGFQRIVLARELSIDQIRKIRQEVKAELEVFIHGALCVSLSGQCYLSHHMTGRSANRGECAQACRMKWSLADDRGTVLAGNKYLLSLKDLNQTASIEELIDAGVDSFKIEGRLKEKDYVANVTAHYNNEINSIIKDRPECERLASGEVYNHFVPDPERSFNRGFTSYFIHGRPKGLINPDSPKSMGKRVGKALRSEKEVLWIAAEEEIHNGDGLCYLEKGELRGIRINTADGNRLICNERVNIPSGTLLYRNYDHEFISHLEKNSSVRKIGIYLTAEAVRGKLILSVTDEDGTEVVMRPEQVFEPANRPEQQERIVQQLMKCGDTDFVCKNVSYTGEVLFVPSAALNGFRRELLILLEQEREKHRLIVRMEQPDEKVVYGQVADWKHNVVNSYARDFYRMHGCETIEAGFEKNPSIEEKELMCTRYCLLYELGRCRKERDNKDLVFPLYLYNDKCRFRLQFDCTDCMMRIVAERT